MKDDLQQQPPQDKQSAAGDRQAFYSYFPATGERGGEAFYKDSPEEINSKVEGAVAAFAAYRQKTGEEKALFLEAIASEIESLGDDLIEICSRETALPTARLQGERGRTAGQLRLFAQLLRDGSWVNARIDTALPDRTPLPRPDLRQMQRPLGPVAVFGASNFPLAFSVAGGDTASALAAGCPVVFKAHEAHPATSKMVGDAVRKAVEKTGMPAGVFSLVFGDGPVAGMQLVKHPAIKAVGFTGSYRAGKAIFDAAAQRAEPIPVYAEMGSLNPVFLLPQAMQQRAEKIAQGFAASLALGVGQFCTNPGLLAYAKTGSESFISLVRTAVQGAGGGCMLTQGISERFQQQVAHVKGVGEVELLAEGSKPAGLNAAGLTVFKTDLPTFLRTPYLKEEMFGPASILVENSSREEMLQFAQEMEGHLTATVHGTDEDLVEYQDLLQILEQKVGRIVINGYPTGVEVSHAMVHGGPFPATTDSRTTSVGTTAIYRFSRPVCYQDFPQSLLPEELRNDNSLHIQRLVNGQYSREKIQGSNS